MFEVSENDDDGRTATTLEGRHLYYIATGDDESSLEWHHIAADDDETARAFAEGLGCGPVRECREVPDEEVVELFSRESVDEFDDYEVIRMTAREWAASSEPGPKFVASTCDDFQ